MTRFRRNSGSGINDIFAGHQSLMSSMHDRLDRQRRRIRMLILIGAIAWLVIGAAMMFWTDYNLEHWLTHFKGIPVEIPNWISAALSMALGPFALLVNAVSHITIIYLA